MRKLFVILLVFSCLPAMAQKADLRKGNRQFAKGQFAEADISYRRALLQDTTSAAARYNLANALYREENLEEAAKQLDAVDAMSVVGTPLGADYFFNRGDVAVKQQDWKTAMDSFRQSLLLRPDDIAAKENYIYARNKYLEQQSQDQQNQDQNQDQNQQDQNQDQQNQDQQQDQNQDQQNQQNRPDQPKQDKQDRQQQAGAGELSPQQAQQLLQAIQDKEKQTQEKVDAKKAEAVKSRQKEKNW